MDAEKKFIRMVITRNKETEPLAMPTHAHVPAPEYAYCRDEYRILDCILRRCVEQAMPMDHLIAGLSD